ncbi:MAG: class II glutamine amidotransferase [Alphaproteobacteria bacterium]|nr:class II glutamine amidotransferase [Alphaproteobacteria bacterium]
MCRWAAYLGEPILLEDLVLKPAHSLIQQSIHAVESKSEVNADGFGVAWYGEHSEPGRYRDILPAWSDGNLRSIVHHVRSRLFMAHVRASTGTETSRANCHPFVQDRWTFMHNGQIGDYERIRRSLDMRLPDTHYAARVGTTDSEAIFLLAHAEGLDDDPIQALARALGHTIADLTRAGIDPHIRFTAAMSDGQRLIGVRYATDNQPPTLYHRRWGAEGGWTLASEPTTLEESGWERVPNNSVVTLDGDSITLTPFHVAA